MCLISMKILSMKGMILFLCFKLEITENCCKNQRTSEIIILITGSKIFCFIVNVV